MADGESAHTSAAHAASRESDAALAKSKSEKAGASPTPKRVKGKPAKDSKSKSAPDTSGGGGEDQAIESLWEERAMLDGGEEMPSDSRGFVDAVNDHIDLVRTTELLLRGKDEKSSKSLLEMLLEMRYGREQRAALARSDSLVDIVPQAVRD